MAEWLSKGPYDGDGNRSSAGVAGKKRGKEERKKGRKEERKKGSVGSGRGRAELEGS